MIQNISRLDIFNKTNASKSAKYNHFGHDSFERGGQNDFGSGA